MILVHDRKVIGKIFLTQEEKELIQKDWETICALCKIEKNYMELYVDEFGKLRVKEHIYEAV